MQQLDLCLLQVFIKKSILKRIFLFNSGGQGLELDGPNIIRNGKPMIHRSSDPKRDGPSKIPKILGQAG